MSAITVNAKIRSAMQDSFITTTEASGIVTEAEKGVVTAKEAKAIADLFDRGNRTLPPGRMVTLAIPEFPGEVLMESGAKSALDAFFATESWNRDRLGFRFGPDAVTWVPPAHVVERVLRLQVKEYDAHITTTILGTHHQDSKTLR